jgi:hypothetical protein
MMCAEAEERDKIAAWLMQPPRKDAVFRCNKPYMQITIINELTDRPAGANRFLSFQAEHLRS